MDRWVHACIDRMQVNRWMGACMVIWVDVWMPEWIGQRMHR